jgi:hypothetical protein
LITTLLTNGGILGPLAFSPDGKTIVTANQEGVVQFWHVATRRQIGQPLAAEDQAVVGMAFSPDGAMLATVSAVGTARLWYVETHQEIGGSLADSESIAGMAFSPSGTILATVSGSEAQLWGVALPDHLLPDVCAIAGVHDAHAPAMERHRPATREHMLLIARRENASSAHSVLRRCREGHLSPSGLISEYRRAA